MKYLFLLLPTLAAAQAPAVRYRVAFPNAIHHEARITATFAGVPAGQALRVRMARSSPGRYALHEFIKNVYDEAAADANGKALYISRPDPYSWEVTPGRDGTVQFSYTLYGDRTDGTYAGIDQQHAHLNMPATLCYAQGLEDRAAEVTFEPLPGWKIATQLLNSTGATYTAPNLQYLMDSPTVLGTPETLHTWQDGGRNFEMAIFYNGPASEATGFAQKAQRVVHEAAGVYGGELPAFDFGRYTFLGDYLPQNSGDGMEHRNSTSLTSNRALHGEEELDNLGTVSHEFFHSYNTERIRSQGIEPFDFQRVNMSDALWFGEGFTQYYGDLVLRRAGFNSDDEFYGNVGYWVNARLTSPGAARASAVAMSEQAGFVDAGVSIDPTNRNNTYLSYYIQGAGLALVLDLQLRQRYRTSLDAYMQAVWREFGRPQTAALAPVRAFTLPDLQRVLGTVSKDTAFAGSFFRRYIYGHEAPPFAEALAGAGLALVPATGPGLVQQVQFDNEGRCLVVRGTTAGSGLYRAGLDRGDQLLTLDGQRLDSRQTLAQLLGKHAATDVVPVTVRSRTGREFPAQLSLADAPLVQVQPLEKAGKNAPTAAQKALRTAWLASAAK
ncbi:MAG: M61 family metallopeptidase [Janthinobacterium lividum]